MIEQFELMEDDGEVLEFTQEATAFSLVVSWVNFNDDTEIAGVLSHCVPIDRYPPSERSRPTAQLATRRSMRPRFAAMSLGKSGILRRSRLAPQSSAFTAALLLAGCKSTPPAPNRTPCAASGPLPGSPDRSPPSFKVFHHDASSITLVTKGRRNRCRDRSPHLAASRRRAHAHLRHAQDQPEAGRRRDHKIWFHIYRGSKCASEKYADGPPPCGAQLSCGRRLYLRQLHPSRSRQRRPAPRRGPRNRTLGPRRSLHRIVPNAAFASTSYSLHS